MGTRLGAPPESAASPDRETIRGFFDSIASRYDWVNTVLSLRLDESWRKRAVRLILEGERPESILDLGVGTGKFLEGFFEDRSWTLAVGVDFSNQMLKLARSRLPAGSSLVQADIHDLPFEGESFDLIVSSFTLRSIKNIPYFFKEAHRILKPNGKAAFLCLTRPDSFFLRMLYWPYLKFYLPAVGRLLSKEREAYQFLSASIRAFPSPRELAAKLEARGFHEVSIFPFSGGISTLITARK